MKYEPTPHPVVIAWLSIVLSDHWQVVKSNQRLISGIQMVYVPHSMPINVFRKRREFISVASMRTGDCGWRWWSGWYLKQKAVRGKLGEGRHGERGSASL